MVPDNLLWEEEPGEREGSAKRLSVIGFYPEGLMFDVHSWGDRTSGDNLAFILIAVLKEEGVLDCINVFKEADAH